MAVQRLILLNVAVFVVQLLVNIPLGRPVAHPAHLMPPGGPLIPFLAFNQVWFLRGAIWMPFTYIFLHAGLMHLFLNMLWLFFFGPEVERILSTRKFYFFFLFCGAVGVLATFIPWLLLGSPPIPVVGASGAVMGVLVAFAMVNPDREFYLFPLPMPVNAKALIFIVVLLNIMSAISGTNTSVATHFGGMAAGYVYMKFAPRIRRNLSGWFSKRSSRSTDQEDPDLVGDAVNNIFKFDEEKRRRRH